MSVKLIPHPGGRSRHWYVDISVPAALHDIVGTGRIRRSTHTPDRVRALAEGARIEAQLRAEWAARAGNETRTPAGPPLGDGPHVLNRLPSSPDRIPAQPVALFPALIWGICAMRMAQPGKREVDVRTLSREDRTQDQYHDGLLNRALGYAKDVACLIAPDDPLLPDCVLAFAETERTNHDAISAIGNRNGARFDATEPPCALLSAMIPVYQDYKSGSVDARSVSKAVSVWNRLMAFVGDVPLGEVTAHDIYRFLDDRLHAENRPWSQTYVDGFAQRTLREMFALARTHGHMHADNPLNHLETTPKISKREEKARKRPRFPYTVAQLNTLFASDWYDPNATQWRGKMATDLALRYWGPPISLCHGPRVREMTQLLNSDFMVCENVLLMTIQLELMASDDATPESIPQLPERKLKSESARRTLPVHPQLLALGFADFVRDSQAKHPPGTPLFPSAVPDEGGKAPLWGRAYEEAFLRFVRDWLGFGPGYGNHSFRHLFEDRVRDAQVINGTWPAGLGEFLSGRRLPRDADKGIFRQQSSAIDYGNGFIAAHVQRFIAQIDFAEVVFPPAYREWLACRTGRSHQ
ncbi:hypothetical protein BJG93_00790 [Paraburkholderia sprentiae WSM5005]|uniref:DUF6538 domain-containing protein n=1 Tax=Paraburkholderia sprentiae WSM5005 TaxID=754502 RepID=A0A1I9YCR6_9BURK|nr:DUF6538 domain-containing protein [Paraburkholderia sprentiae]APA84099.2 hypothetical protein BJG93_00790 [Paraburkholderia sprentiae WSM5005]